MSRSCFFRKMNTNRAQKLAEIQTIHQRACEQTLNFKKAVEGPNDGGSGRQQPSLGGPNAKPVEGRAPIFDCLHAKRIRLQVYMHAYMAMRYSHAHIHACAHKHTYMLSGNPPRWYPPPPPARLLRAVPHNRNEPTQTGNRGREASQYFFTGAENRIRAGTGAPFGRRKEQHHILYGNEHVTMTLLLTSGSNHTIPL